MATASGTLNITGGTLHAGDIVLGQDSDPESGSGTGIANVSSGTVNVDSATGIIVGGSATGTFGLSGNAVVNVDGGAGVATVNFTIASGSSAILTPALTGNLSVNQTGAGHTTLASGATDSYTGATTVSAGNLTVNGDITNSTTTVNGGLLDSSGTTQDVTVNSGGTLGGTLHSGNVTVTAGARVTAGDAPGANVMTTLTLSGSATYVEDIVGPGGGHYTGPGNHPVAGTDYGQTTLTGPGNSQTALTPDSTHSILQLNVTGALPAGGVAATGAAYDPAGSNSTLDNYFILNLSDSTDNSTGRFSQATLEA